MPRRIPPPPAGKRLLGFDEIPDWVYTFSVPDDFDLDHATPAELRRAYVDWQAKVQEWRDTHETPSVAACVATADEPWDPEMDPP